MLTVKFSKSYDDALTQAYLFHSGLVRDLLLFTAYSPMFDADYASDFLDLIEDAGSLPTNEEDLNNQVILSMEVEDKMEESRALYRKLISYIKLKWGESDSVLRAFGNNLYEKARQSPQKMINLLELANRAADSVKYKADLIAVGFLQVDITALLTMSEELNVVYNNQQEFMQLSSDRAEERVVAFNKIWDIMVQINNASKQVFKDSPALIEYYLLYPESSSPGSLTAPTDLSFYLPSTTFSWSEVPHATSYSFEISTDGISFTEQYNGSETSCSYTPEQEGWMWYRVRARNANGFGPYSTVLQQGYYPGTVLPAPENLVLQLAAGSPNTIELTWSPVPSATTFTVNRSIVAIGASPGPFSFVTNTHDPEYVETVIPGNRIYFNLTAQNSNQWSGVSVNVFIDVV